MVSFSNYTYEPSLGTRTSAGKPLVTNQNAFAILISKLYQMFRDIAWIQTKFNSRSGLKTSHRVFAENFMMVADKELPSQPVDLMITSPPYMNNYHYVRNTRPQLYWLALVKQSSQIRDLEEENFGKFWQNVRHKIPIEPIFKNPKLNQLIQNLAKIREEKGAYGGGRDGERAHVFFYYGLQLFLGLP